MKTNSYPFTEIFILYRQEMPIYKIAKQVGISAVTISQILAGTYEIPKKEVKKLREADFAICGACGKRVVPIVPINNYTKLTRLCQICYRLGGEEEANKIILSHQSTVW